MATYRAGRWWQARVGGLQAMGYRIQRTILNTNKHHGDPQNRPRLWVVGIRKATLADGKAFGMPGPLPDQLRLSLTAILIPPSATDDSRARPKAPGAALTVNKAPNKGDEAPY